MTLRNLLPGRGGPSDAQHCRGGGAVTAPAHTARSSGSQRGPRSGGPVSRATSWGGEPEWVAGLEAKSSPSKARVPSL